MRVKIDKLFIVGKVMGLIKIIRENRERNLDKMANSSARVEIRDGKLKAYEKDAFNLGFKMAYHETQTFMGMIPPIILSVLFISFAVGNLRIREAYSRQIRITEFYQENDLHPKDMIPEYLDIRMDIWQDESKLKLLDECKKDSLYNSN